MLVTLVQFVKIIPMFAWKNCKLCCISSIHLFFIPSMISCRMYLLVLCMYFAEVVLFVGWIIRLLFVRCWCVCRCTEKSIASSKQTFEWTDIDQSVNRSGIFKCMVYWWEGEGEGEGRWGSRGVSVVSPSTAHSTVHCGFISLIIQLRTNKPSKQKITFHSFISYHIVHIIHQLDRPINPNNQSVKTNQIILNQYQTINNLPLSRKQRCSQLGP